MQWLRPCIKPKSERSKSGKRQNRNKWWFGFWHIPILNVRALKFLGSKLNVWLLIKRPKWPKSEQIIVQNLKKKVLILDDIWNRTVLNWAKSESSENKTSSDFGIPLYTMPNFWVYLFYITQKFGFQSSSDFRRLVFHALTVHLYFRRGPLCWRSSFKQTNRVDFLPHFWLQ